MALMKLDLGCREDRNAGCVNLDWQPAVHPDVLHEDLHDFSMSRHEPPDLPRPGLPSPHSSGAPAATDDKDLTRNY